MTAATLIHDSLRAHTPEGAWVLRFRRRGYQKVLVVRSQVNLYYFWEKRWFFIAMALGFVLLSMPSPEGLTREGQIVLAMSIVATVLFITEPVPLPTVALLIIGGEVLLITLFVIGLNLIRRAVF